MAEAPDRALVGRVRDVIVREGRGADPAAVRDVLREVAGVLGTADADALSRAVAAELGGAGPLQPLVDADGVTDVLVEGGRAWVDRGHGLERAGVDLGGPGAVRALAVRLAAAAGQRLDDAAPVADGRLPDGTRLHAVLPPVADGGPLISLRVHRPVPWTLEELVTAGAVPVALADLLAGLVARRANVLVSGATGTGKTTLVGALLSLVPPDERIVCVEEAGELAPRHPHLVRLLARRANVEGAGAVDLADLVRHALRMRPDRIVLGECRGPEVREVLTALNTGHDGGWATVHANAATDVPARLEALGALAGMSPRAVTAQAATALDAVVHLARTRGRRHVAQVGRVRRDDDVLRVEEVAAWSPDGPLRTGASWPCFVDRWSA
ncbi:TadA family conjugal transfer-associated ATPase [Actinotalea sp. AC32]|nr:TadA family conjugal transfer-associated ATPase [Actinotalea sp. AC32]